MRDEKGNPLTTTDEDGYTHRVYDDEAMRANSLEVATRTAIEGSVLMWNKSINSGESALPLPEAAGISFFGVGAVDYTHHGGGSGHVSIISSDDLLSACEREGLRINKSLWSSYRLAKGSGYGRVYGKNAAGNTVSDNNYIEFKIGEIPFAEATKTCQMPSGIGVYGDAAVMVISRYGSEDGDTSFNSTECLNNNYMDLAKNEDQVLTRLDALRAQNYFKRIILVINSPVAMSLRNISKHNIDACLWVGLGGNASYTQVSKLLSGHAYPSGHLTIFG